MLGLLFGDNGHRNGRRDRRSKTYRCDDSDTDSDFEAPPEHKVSRFVGDVSEQLVQPLEIATKMVLNPVNLLFSPPPPPKQGKKGRQGQHHSGQRMQHQDRVMAHKLTRY